MFNKTRRKIVFAVAASLLAMMAVTLGTIIVSNKIAMQRENEDMLRMYVERFYSDDRPIDKGGEKTDGPREDAQEMRGNRFGPRDGEAGIKEPRFQLSTFYSVEYSPDGEVIFVDNGNDALQSASSIVELASSIIKSGRTSGRTGNITYLVDTREDRTLVAMIDGTINAGNQSVLFKEILIIGSIALAVLFVISVFLAKWIVKPLEENDRRQKRFVSDAGHELKTPIAVISANSELLRREVGENEWLDNIDYENGRMSDLVKQLLALSRAENGEMIKETLDFSELVSGEALPFETLAFEKGKNIEEKTEQGIKVKGDANRLRQLVSILLDNALSHGTGETVELTLYRERKDAVLTVANDAPKMSSGQIAHLFDRFYRTDEARNEADSHYGLGLSIAKAIADAHGGNIRAEYKDGRAIFTVSLPIEKS